MLKTPTQISEECQKQITLLSNLRRVWAQHVWWSRLYILSIVYDLPYQDLIFNRTLRNSSDFFRFLERFYTPKQLKPIETLFEEYNKTKSTYLYNKVAGNSYAASIYRKRWYEIADQLADLMYQLNPFLPPSRSKPLIYSLIEGTDSQVENMLIGQTEKEIMFFDMIELEAYEFADFIATGMMSHFGSLPR